MLGEFNGNRLRTGLRLDYYTNYSVISQERLTVEVKLLSSANRNFRKSYTPRRLAQRMTLSDLELTFYASRAVSAVAELLV